MPDEWDVKFNAYYDANIRRNKKLTIRVSGETLRLYQRMVEASGQKSVDFFDSMVAWRFCDLRRQRGGNG